MLFELNNINHFYGALHALKDISVNVSEGTVGLLGPNGAGKTTLIRTLLGLLDPYAGDGQVLGQNIRTHSVEIRQNIGYMPEHECIFSDLTGIEAVTYAAKLCGLPHQNAVRRAHEVLDYAGVAEERYRPCSGYSTGYRQRIKLAQALVHGPKLVLLDEPTNGLDPEGRDDMLSLIKALSSAGVSVVLSTHLLQDVERVCDDVLVLVDGAVRHYGTLSDLTEGQSGQYEIHVKNNGELLENRLIQAGLVVRREPQEANRMMVTLRSNDIQLFWKTAVDAGVQVRHFSAERMSLEHAFVQLMETK